jgi:hypothetical protein
MPSVTPHRITKREADGKTEYVYADPDNCKCLFVGDDSAYERYRANAQRREDIMNYDAAREQQRWGRP